jgi:membrane-associated protease RseP (regulator of RpoE activity)
MLSRKKILSILVIAMTVGQVHAQSQEEELEAELRKAEAKREAMAMEMVAERRELEVEMERAAVQMKEAATQHQAAMAARARSDRSVEVEVRMREAEQAMAVAAQQMGQLSMRQLPRVAMVERIVQANRGPVLGVSISAEDNDDPVEGVSVIGVSPGGAAAEAGLQAGDVITAVNDESLTADNGKEANQKLLDFMRGVEDGDELEIEFLRDGKTQTVELSPRPMHVGSFSFDFDGEDFVIPDIEVVHEVPRVNRFVWVTESGGFGDMELVKLTENLGNYFGTTEGLLVVRAPENEDLKLSDGDVIQSIDGREPTSASHAMRILGSYESGETLTIEIMRDKRKQTVSIEVPDNENEHGWAVTPDAVDAPSVKIIPRKEPN